MTLERPLDADTNRGGRNVILWAALATATGLITLALTGASPFHPLLAALCAAFIGMTGVTTWLAQRISRTDPGAETVSLRKTGFARLDGLHMHYANGKDGP
ncbi:hypothetical protein [Roseibium sp. RKSG952]|uniref:hypothetical protein n=1 Tax=Roseibium sp. RKSG952 TaxID=2529384 RepID=UPI0012BCA909|nr:hypothetical protein [Roseibium sp. RKSG952]MTH99603.1 hypothetical protein [Roseibium sp. RKSG952]